MPNGENITNIFNKSHKIEPISAKDFVPLFVFTFLYIALKNILCKSFLCPSKGSKVFCKHELHALSKKTVLNISLNSGLNLTIFLVLFCSGLRIPSS